MSEKEKEGPFHILVDQKEHEWRKNSSPGSISSTLPGSILKAMMLGEMYLALRIF